MLPIAGNPRKRKHKRGGKSSYHRFVKSFLRRYKGAGLKGAAAAWSCKKHGMRGKWKGFRSKISKAGRRRAHAHVRHHRRRHKAVRARMGYGKKLVGAAYRAYGRLSELVYTGSATKAQSKRYENLKKREEAYQRKVAGAKRAHGSRQWKAARAAEDASLGYSHNPRRKRHMRHHRNPSAVASGIAAGFKPSNLTAALPIIGGAIANGLLRGMISSRVPMLAKGLPSILLGLGTAGLVGMAGGYVSPKIGKAMALGGGVEVLSELFVNLAGGKGLGYVDIDLGADWNGATLSDYADLRQAAAASSIQSDMSQYPFPMDPTQIVLPGGPMEQHGAQHPAMAQHAPQMTQQAAVASAMHDYDISSM